MALFSKARSRIYSGVRRLLHHRSVETIKGFLLGGYQKLPKPPTFLVLTCREPKVHQSFRKYDNFYSDASGYYVFEDEMHKSDLEHQPMGKEYEEASVHSDQQSDQPGGHHGTSQERPITGSFLNFGNIRNGRLVSRDAIPNANKADQRQKPVIGNDKAEQPNKLAEQSSSTSSSSSLAMSRAEACLQFEQKLRDMVIDQNDPEDLVDIHEFLHYYSRLTSPFYIDMVNRFFMDICG
eukprot:Gb_11295 [translate_table: standard]